MAGNGSRFPMGMPPMPGGGGSAPLQVAAPMNDFQFFGLLAAQCMAFEEVPGIDDVALRDTQANRAALRALDLIGVCGFYMNNGAFADAIKRGTSAGTASRKAAIEAEPSQVPEPPPSKLITGDDA